VCSDQRWAVLAAHGAASSVVVSQQDPCHGIFWELVTLVNSDAVFSASSDSLVLSDIFDSSVNLCFL
jgi:hypothetical protein